MSYQPPGFSNNPKTPNGAPDFGPPPYMPEGPTDAGGSLAPPPDSFAPPPTGPTASYGGYPPAPLPPAPLPLPPGPNASYSPPGGYGPPPPYGAPPMQPMYGPPPVIYQSPLYRPVPQPAGGAAVAVEVLAGVFGVWGVGWLMSGYTAVGVTLLIVGLLVVPGLFVALTVLTLGFGVVTLPCFFIADVIVVAVSAVKLSNRLRSGPAPL